MTDSTDRPDPLVPAEVDLRGLEYMPLLGDRLFESDFNLDADDTEFRIGLRLWWKSWRQVPAGSLPAEDERLRKLAGLEEAPAKWKRVRDRALHGFVECSDGRLYHPVVAQQALIAWEKRVDGKAEKAGEAERKARERQERSAMFEALKARGVTPKWNTPTGELRRLHAAHVTEPVTAPVTPPVTGPVTPPVTVTVTANTVRDDTVRYEEAPATAGAARAPDPPPGPPPAAAHGAPTPYGLIARAIRTAGIGGVSPSNPRFRALVDAGATAEEFTAHVAKALRMSQPFAYLVATVEGERQRAAATAATLHRGALPPQQPANRQQALEDSNRQVAEAWAKGTT